MKGRLVKFGLLMSAMVVLFASCGFFNTDPDTIIYGQGLVGVWIEGVDGETPLQSGFIRVENKIADGVTITDVQVIQADAEPLAWTTPNKLINGSGVLVPLNFEDETYSVANTFIDISLGSTPAGTYYIRVEDSNDDYLVAGFFYDGTYADKWWLVVKKERTN